MLDLACPATCFTVIWKNNPKQWRDINETHPWKKYSVIKEIHDYKWNNTVTSIILKVTKNSPLYWPWTALLHPLQWYKRNTPIKMKWYQWNTSLKEIQWYKKYILIYEVILLHCFVEKLLKPVQNLGLGPLLHPLHWYQRNTSWKLKRYNEITFFKYSDIKEIYS